MLSKTIAIDQSAPVSVTEWQPGKQFSKLWLYWQLKLRADKYAGKEDRGGIACIKQSVQKGDTVFDIGAHKGGYLYFFQQQLQGTGTIVAFEPQNVLYNYLLKVRALLGWDNLLPEHAAVSDHQGKALLSIPVNKGQSSSPCATIIKSKMLFEIGHSEEVDTQTLDVYCKKKQLRPRFLKVDVEGNEYAVFSGASAVLQRYKPKILFESEARFVGDEQVLATFHLLHTYGYNGYFIRDKSYIPISRFRLEEHQHAGCKPYCNNFIFE